MDWYSISNPEKVASPALLVYPDRIRQNISEMLRVAGTGSRLRPHIKTHKCREIVYMQQKAGINKFKCATIAEAEMLGDCQAQDVLLAYQPVGPTITRLFSLVEKFPSTTFSALVDNQNTARSLEEQATSRSLALGVYIDLNVGMNRTGIMAGPLVEELKSSLQASKYLNLRGWHLYDGHIRQRKFSERKEAVNSAYLEVAAIVEQDLSLEVIAGGTPTFPVHAMNSRVDLSPGTCLLWDYGYSQGMPDLNFQHAAVLLTRIISKPGRDLLCVDLGHKAVASEMPHPRVYFPELGQPNFVKHSEEHLVMETAEAEKFSVGDILYGIPVHICPTTALHQELVVVDNGQATDRWQVYARNRRISI